MTTYINQQYGHDNVNIRDQNNFFEEMLSTRIYITFKSSGEFHAFKGTFAK